MFSYHWFSVMDMHAGKLVCALGVKLFMVHAILIGVFKAPETWLMSL